MTRSHLFTLASLLLFFAFSACTKDEVTDPSDPTLDTNSFTSLINSAGPPAPVTTALTTTELASTSETRGNEIWKCTTTTVDQQQGGGGSEGYPLFSPNASVIYPGNLLQGASLSKATPDLIPVARAGGSFSIDVIDGNITASFDVDEVKKSTVSTALNAIVADATGVVPANFSFNYESIQSKRQLAASMRINYETFASQVEGKLSFSTDKEYQRYIVTLNQSYYTMSYDVPTSLDDIFDPSVTPEDLARYTSPGNPVTYISDVTYGRTYYMLIESTSSKTEMSAAISGSFNGVAASVDGEANVDAMSDLQNLNIKVFGYGGESGATLQTLGVTNLQVLSGLLARAGTITSGKPLSYVVRSMYDNRIVSTQLATSYDITNCVPVAPSSFPYTAHWTDKVLNTLGPVGAAYCDTLTNFVLISKDGTQFVRSQPGELTGPFAITDLFDGQSPPFAGISAACNISGNEDNPNNNGQTILLVDGTGTQFCYWLGSRFTSPQAVSRLGGQSGAAAYPLTGAGVGAIGFHYLVDQVGSGNRHVFNAEGNAYAYMRYNGNSRWTGPWELWKWGPDRSHPFNAVGAAIGFRINDKYFSIQFDKPGKRYTVYANLLGQDESGAIFNGAYDL